jgi:hypothetical protein
MSPITSCQLMETVHLYKVGLNGDGRLHQIWRGRGGMVVCAAARGGGGVKPICDTSCVATNHQLHNDRGGALVHGGSS